QALSLAVDRQIFADAVMLQTLAQSPLLERGELRGFHAVAARAIAEHGGLFISLFDEKGRQIFNTLRAPCAPLPTPFEYPAPPDPERPPLGDPSALEEVRSTSSRALGSPSGGRSGSGGAGYSKGVGSGAPGGRSVLKICLPFSSKSEMKSPPCSPMTRAATAWNPRSSPRSRSGDCASVWSITASAKIW